LTIRRLYFISNKTSEGANAIFLACDKGNRTGIAHVPTREFTTAAPILLACTKGIDDKSRQLQKILKAKDKSKSDITRARNEADRHLLTKNIGFKSTE
jgi:hypothetical protein